MKTRDPKEIEKDLDAVIEETTALYNDWLHYSAAALEQKRASLKSRHNDLVRELRQAKLERGEL